MSDIGTQLTEARELVERLEKLENGGARKEGPKDPPPADPNTQRIQFEANERQKELDESQRVSEILSLGAKYNMGREALDATHTTTTVEEFRTRVMDSLAEAGRVADLPDGASIRMGEDDRTKYRTGMAESLLYRGARGHLNPKGTDYGANPFMGDGFVALAHQSLRNDGLDPRQFQGPELWKRAMTTSDFASVTANVANKTLFDAFDTAGESWQIFCSTGSLADYKPSEFPRVGEYSDFGYINANGGEHPYLNTSDAKESATLKKWGGISKFSEQLLVNDDAGAFVDEFARMGRAAARRIGDLVFAGATWTGTTYDGTLMSNSGTGEVMGDSNNLFDATNHSNWVASGAGSAPSLANLNTGAKAMATQTDTAGNAYLNIQPVYILAGYSLKATIDNLLTTVSPVAVSTTTATNPWSYLTPVYDARIDGAISTWWALLGPSSMTIKVFGLNGPPRVELDSRAVWANDCMEWKGTVRGTSKAMDWRGLWGNYGA